MYCAKKVEKKIVISPVLPLIYDPRLPNISNILYRFWKVMILNPILKRISLSRPWFAGVFLIKAKPSKEIYIRRSSHEKLGFKHCGKNCMIFNYSQKLTNSVVSSVTKEKISKMSYIVLRV